MCKHLTPGTLLGLILIIAHSVIMFKCEQEAAAAVKKARDDEKEAATTAAEAAAKAADDAMKSVPE